MPARERGLGADRSVGAISTSSQDFANPSPSMNSLLWNDFNADRRLAPVFIRITNRYLTPFSNGESLSVGCANDLRGFCKEKCLRIAIQIFDGDGAGRQIDFLQLTNGGL